MALSQQQLADLAAWVDQYAAATDDLSTKTYLALAAMYASVNFYNPAVAAQVSAEAAEASNTASLMAAGLAAQYLAITSSTAAGQAVPVPNLPLPPLRNGADMRRVFERPMKLFRRKVSEGMAPDEAFAHAMRLVETLADTNIRLAQREFTREALTRLEGTAGVTGYRRVVRPELSRTGTCGLCLTASDRIYNVRELLPMHDRCKCVVLPIIGAIDPGNSLNNLSLGDLYAAAADLPGATRRSGTDGRDLKRVRYVVNEHGELGPVLSVAGHDFTGPDGLAPAA